jgi:5'-nucleotidase / UDP-sugar diphosphatase
MAPLPERLAISATISRRLLLRAAAVSTAAFPFTRLAAAEQNSSDFRLIVLADLHSPYQNLPQLLRAVRDAVGGAPAAIVINGDIFERGNVAAFRSDAAVDWQFVEALAGEAPLIINLGNHETAILDDMATFVSRAERLGATVIGNILDQRTGRFFAPASAKLTIGGRRLGIMGLAATNPFVYREPVRETLGLLEPVEFVRSAFDPIMAGADIPVVLSHAGVVADRAILASLPDGTLIVGGHDHLTLDHAENRTRYFHGGSWGNAITAVDISAANDGPRYDITRIPISTTMPADEALGSAVSDVLARHLNDEDKEAIAEVPEARDLAASILFAVEAVRQAVDADVAFLGHTTFGAGMAAGTMTRYDFDAFVRFDGEIQVVEVSGDVLAAIMTRANQHLAASLTERTGDFVYAREIGIDPAGRYRIAANDWTAMNQQAYLGTDGLAFQTVDGVMLKPTVEQALRAL